MRKATGTKTSHAPTRRSAASALAALGCVVTLAACGSSSATTTSTTAKAANGESMFLRYSECMRSNGVPNFPDPSTSGGGIHITLSSGMNPFSPAFKAAQATCRKLLPGGGPGGAPSEQAKQQLLTISQCMRAHGVPDFPDPTTTAPSSKDAASEVIGRGGYFLAVPSTIDTSSPAYQHAAAACGFGVQ